MKADSSFPRTPYHAAIEVLSTVFPVELLAHIGPGPVGDDALIELTTPEKVIMFDAQIECANRLTEKYADQTEIHIQNAVLASQKARTVFFNSSLRTESGLVSSSFLSPFWQNIRDISETDVETETYDNLVEELPSTFTHGSKPNWLVVNCFPGLDILKGAEHSLEIDLDVVIVRVIHDQVNLDDAALCDCLDDKITEHMKHSGFRRVSFFQNRHPNLGMTIFVKDLNLVMDNDKRVEKELLLARQDLSELREKYKQLSHINSDLNATLNKTAVEIGNLLNSRSTNRSAKSKTS